MAAASNLTCTTVYARRTEVRTGAFVIAGVAAVVTLMITFVAIALNTHIE